MPANSSSRGEEPLAPKLVEEKGSWSAETKEKEPIRNDAGNRKGRSEVPQPLSGLSLELGSFLETQGQAFMREHPEKIGCDEYFFSISGLAKDWTEDQEIDLQPQDWIYVHRRSRNIAFSVAKAAREAREAFGSGGQSVSTRFSLSHDGSVVSYRDDVSAVPIGEGSFKVTVSPGYMMEGFPTDDMPVDVIQEEAQRRASEVIEILFKCGQLINMTRSIHVTRVREI